MWRRVAIPADPRDCWLWTGAPRLEPKPLDRSFAACLFRRDATRVIESTATGGDGDA